MKIFAAATLIIALGAVPASAQPLQQQLSRCLGIPGVLQRLNCYDSVARGAGIPPMAAAAPAPAYRAPATASAAPVYAPPAMGAERLPRAAAATPAPPVYAPPVYAAPVPSIGSERLPQTAAAAPPREDAQTAGIAKIVFDGVGRFTMTLDNGQVWRQLAGDQVFLRGTRFSSAHISRGSFGSYDLTVDKLHASYRVTRIQ